MNTAGNYIPEPRPVRSDIEVTALYYPGTEQMAEWDMLAQTLPGIRPLLGWYDEGNPENVDWQIKWAAEHGISNFCVDWYWDRGVQRLDHWVKAFYKAHFRSYIKWFIMWANHNPPGSHSEADMGNVCRFWIDNYFKTPEYYTIGGKPAVVLWDIEAIDKDFLAEAAEKGETLQTGQGLRRALDLCRNMAKEAGLPGISFLGMYNVYNDYRTIYNLAVAGGCEALMMYNCGHHDSSYTQEELKQCGKKNHFTYQMAMDKAVSIWNATALDKTMPVWPILPAGWNDKPRTFQNARVVTGRTPELFRKLCSDCHTFCGKNGLKHAVIAPVNEWQEGTYIEPNAEYGFEMLDALREGFCSMPEQGWPLNLQPASTGRPLLEYPPLPHLPVTEWTFEHDTCGWYRNPYGTALLRAENGLLSFRRGYLEYAAIRTRPAPFSTAKFSRLRLKMKCKPHPSYPPQGTECLKLYWGTEEYPVFTPDLVIQEGATCTTPLSADGEWHEYVLEPSGNPHWTGFVNELWFDPGHLPMCDVLIQWMRFE